MNVKVYHNGQQINWRIPADSFPDIAVSFKGDGYYEFEVEPVSFKINRNGLTLAVNDNILITDLYGNTIVNGYIDELDDELSNPVEVTVFPHALKLKSIKAGTEVTINEDTENQQTATDFITTSYASVRDIVNKLVNDANTATGWNFKTSAAAVPDPTPGSGRYFGSILDELPNGKLTLTDELIRFRQKDGKLYVHKKLSGWVMKTLFKAGAISANLVFPKDDWSILGTTVKRGAWIKWGFSFPDSDLEIPWPLPTHDIFRCEYGDLTHIKRYEIWVPSPLMFGYIANIKEMYGAEYNSVQYDNIASEAVIADILSELGYRMDTVESVCDTDAFNSYAIVTAHKKYNDVFGRVILLSIEKTGDFYYKLHYRNSNIMDILKDLAIVTDRYLYISPEDEICLLPRDGAFDTVDLNRKYVLERKKKTENLEEPTITVNRYIENEKGEPESYGIILRDNEWNNIEAMIKEKNIGTRVKYRWKVLNPPPSLALMKKITMDGEPYGVVIDISTKHTDKIAEFTTEVANV